MRSTLIYAPGDIRLEDRPDPTILEPTDAVVRTVATWRRTVMEMTGGIGAHTILECVGTADSVVQALRSARAGRMVGWVGVPHVTALPQEHMFRKNVGLRGGPAPVAPISPTCSSVCGMEPSSPARSSISRCPWSTSPRRMRPWISAAPPKCCCVRDPTATGTR